MLFESGALKGGRSGVDDCVFGVKLGVQLVVVEDGIAEVEDGGFSDDAIGLVVVEGISGFDVGGAVSGGAHGLVKDGGRWVLKRG